MGLYNDANITTKQFSNLALFFYVSYLVLEFPHGYGMQRLPTAKYLGTCVALWGLITAITCVCKNYGALVATRILLGCFESAVAPSLILITSMWYKKKEQPLRTGLWYVGVGTGTMIGSLISFGFQHYYSPTFTSWQIMFLVVGLITVALGVTGKSSLCQNALICILISLVIFLLPDNPMLSRLSPAEKVWAIERLRENMTGMVTLILLTYLPASSNKFRHREQTTQMASSCRMPERSPNLAHLPHHNFLQCPQRRRIILPGHPHPLLRLRLQDYCTPPTSLRRRECHINHYSHIPRWPL
jgi:MFS family permease